ncbi:MAG TPA: outer membrane protein assembly factor BamA, partial [Thermodesulfovibrionales bacterium]|nr:outer membrane protein assembly factor BamA [Thermodesulfovibrionales bacterium]
MIRVSPAMLVLYLLAAIIVTGDASDVLAQGAPIVNSITVKGLKRIEEGAVKSKITQKTGEPISNEKISEDIKNIYKMGYFDDVTAEMEPQEGGIQLIYVVKEKPTIVRVSFQGNKELADDKLKEKVGITAGSIADTTLIQDNALKIQQYYEEEGYWLATVVPVVNRVGENEVSLTYLIDEGKKVKVKKIVIEGNQAISSSQVRKAMKTSTWNLLSFLTSSGYYTRQTMNADVEAIKDLYFNNGYIKVVVAEPEISLTGDKSGMIITIRIAEGSQYRIASVDISGNKAYPEELLRSRIMLSPGVIFSKEILKKDIAAVTELYTQNGYALANVFPDVVADDVTKQVSLTYKIEEGSIYHIGRIEVSGNTKTKDKVIRREVRLDEGDLFNSALLKRSYERLNNLNYFETVELVPKPKYEEKVLDIDVKVKEKATGFISVGGGYSSVDGIIGMVDVTQSNLFGTGKYLRVRAELGGKSSFYELSYRDPWFMDKPISFTADLYHNTRTYPLYEERATGFGFGFGKSYGEYWSANIAYNLSQPTIFNINPTASIVIQQQVGTNLNSSITPSVTRDSRDNYLDPSSGSRNSLFVNFTGLGGTNDFVKGVADSAWFFPIGKTGTTIMLRGRLGYAVGIFGKDVPLYENFYVGGIYTV